MFAQALLVTDRHYDGLNLSAPSEQCTTTLQLQHAKGLDAALAAQLVQKIQPFIAECRINCGASSANSRSLVELLQLQLIHGSRFTVAAFGPDANELIRSINLLLTAPLA